MYVNKHYGFWKTLHWSRKPFIYGMLYAGVITCIQHFSGYKLTLPWQPMSVIGITVAFYLGFKNNSSYDRTWEARKIWGAIVNASRSFGAAVNAYVQGPDAASHKKELIYRHIAWLTALRYQLRTSRNWEHVDERLKHLYSATICEGYFEKLDDEILQFITKEEFEALKSKANMATQLLAVQSSKLQDLKDKQYFDDFRHMALQNLIESFYDEQGKSERIKNFPFPRQYASAALWVSVIFALLLPFGMLDTFTERGGCWVWWNIPLSGLVIWVFFLMEKIGDYSENPFEGTYNDIPITAIARGIEIDLREMIGDADIPGQIQPVNGFLM